MFVQAGVGGLAGALAHMIRANWAVQPRIVVVEPGTPRHAYVKVTARGNSLRSNT